MAIDPAKIEQWKETLKNLPPEPPRPLHRFGRFRVGLDIFRKNPMEALPVFAGVVVTKAVSDYRMDCIEYEALCDEFREVPHGEEPPMYYAQMWRNEDGSVVRKGWEEAPV